MLMALVTCVLWGLESVLVKLSGVHFTSGLLTLSYFSLSAICFGALVLIKRSPLAALKGRAGAFAALGGVCLMCFYYLFVAGVQLSGPAQASVLLQSEPYFVALLAFMFLKERLKPSQVPGFIISFIGFGAFALDRWTYAQSAGSSLSESDWTSGSTAGNLLVLLAALVWSGYALCQRRLCRELPALSASFAIFAVAAVLALVFVPPGPPPDFTMSSSLLLATTSLMALLAYAALGEALGATRAAVVTLIANLNPLVTIGASLFLLSLGTPGIESEQISWLGYTGAGIILLGSILVARKE